MEPTTTSGTTAETSPGPDRTEAGPTVPTPVGKRSVAATDGAPAGGAPGPSGAPAAEGGLGAEAVADTPVEEVAATVSRARRAAGAWARRTPAERATGLLAVRDALLERMDEVVRTVVAETGKLATEAIVNEVMVACEQITWDARQAPRLLAPRRVPAGLLAHKRAEKRYEPLGVVAVISPWNYPIVLSLGPICAALAAGNAVVFKPSELTPRTGLALAGLFEALGPHAEAVQVVTGGGAVGDALVRSGVDKVSFTGSVATGRAVMQAAAETLTPVVLELGGKDPMIVCADADLDRAARAAVWGAFTNCGQTCIGTERVYVVDEVHDAFVDKVLAQVRRLRQAADGDVGAMIHEGQVQLSESHVADALAKGATVAAGGDRTAVDGRAAFAPTVLLGVDHTMEAMREETFGPLLPIMRVRDPEEALALANDSPYGLSASVFAKDPALVERLVDGLQAGNVCVNDVMIAFAVPSLPFGGVKSSGVGTTHGEEGLLEFARVKSVARDRLGLGREPNWLPLPGRLGRATARILPLRYRFGRGRRS